MYAKRVGMAPILQVNNKVKLRMAFAPEQRRTYVEFEGNKNDIIDVLIAFGITVLLLSIAATIIRM